ncbi:MAG: hypothetical protein ACI96P_000115 [Candidatus Azotimanducaceae bacterium]|jgi:hypothetical protein
MHYRSYVKAAGLCADFGDAILEGLRRGGTREDET